MTPQGTRHHLDRLKGRRNRKEWNGASRGRKGRRSRIRRRTPATFPRRAAAGRRRRRGHGPVQVASQDRAQRPRRLPVRQHRRLPGRGRAAVRRNRADRGAGRGGGRAGRSRRPGVVAAGLRLPSGAPLRRAVGAPAAPHHPAPHGRRPGFRLGPELRAQAVHARPVPDPDRRHGRRDYQPKEEVPAPRIPHASPTGRPHRIPGPAAPGLAHAWPPANNDGEGAKLEMVHGPDGLPKAGTSTKAAVDG